MEKSNIMKSAFLIFVLTSCVVRSQRNANYGNYYASVVSYGHNYWTTQRPPQQRTNYGIFDRRPTQQFGVLTEFTSPPHHQRSHKLIKTTTATATTTSTPTTTTEKQWDKRESDFKDTSQIIQRPPLSVLKAMSNITDPLEFLARFALPEGHPTALASSSSGRKGLKAEGPALPSLLERNIESHPFAPSATCSPQPTTIPINLGNNPYDIYFPSCTRIERCGGCCSHDLLECAPLKTETATFQVLKTRYLGPPVNKFDVGQLVPYETERHLECQCQCRVKESDCNYYQIYRPNECRCECRNQDDAKNCVGDKTWDPSTCSCRCRELSECSTGFFFNMDTCICEVRRVSKMGFGPAFRGF